MEEKLWWVPDDKEVWVIAKQAGEPLPNGCMKFNILGSGKQVMLTQNLCLRTSMDYRNPNATPDDLISLPEVNQASILSCTRIRFAQKKIYTSVGSVLISVNPFERIANLYGPKMVQKYVNPFAEGGLAPHVYVVPSRAFSDMKQFGRNQSILISGESGAGKTEATKGCLAFLTSVAETTQSYSLSAEKIDIAGRIIAASPILEAFGNAKTKRNPNSSRFGKWMELNFNDRNILSGSSIISYLLENSRVTRRDPAERNYHIFYQLLRSGEAQTMTALNLNRDTSQYAYLRRPGLEEAPDLGDQAGFVEVKDAFRIMGFTEAETMSVFKIVAAVLHLGNIEFMDKEDGETSAVAPNSMSAQYAAGLLFVPETTLNESLCHRTVSTGTIRRSVIRIGLNAKAAADTRDSLSRTLYDRIFREIINRINSLATSGIAAPTDHARKIGLLDIFGFEIFDENSLEQLCINYCNEMLQNHFNYVIFTAEKALYAAEGIVCDTIEFKDNVPIINEIQNTFKTLDEEAKIPKGSSKTWYDKLRRANSANKNSPMAFPPRKDTFIVKHYAGNVEYIPLSFMEKNTETLTNELMMAMMASQDHLIQKLFAPVEDPDAAAGSGPKKAPVQRSISWKFQNQLIELMAMLKKTQSHFIRCIKSNEKCEAMVFDAQLVHKQLLYSGVFEVVKIQQSGLPCRLPHGAFVDRYKCLAPSSSRWALPSTSSMTLVNILKAGPKGMKLPTLQSGNSLTFFKGFEQSLLELARDKLLNRSATLIQKTQRMRSRSRLYIILRGYVKDFNEHTAALDYQACEHVFERLKSQCDLYAKVSKFPILDPFLLRAARLVELTKRRSLLVFEASNLIESNTEESLIQMKDLVSRAATLGISDHRDVLTCRKMVKDYEIALQFIDDVSSETSISNLSLDDIAIGINVLKTYEAIVPSAAEALGVAVRWKHTVENEIENIFHPLLRCFRMCLLAFDDVAGDFTAAPQPTKEDLALPDEPLTVTTAGCQLRSIMATTDASSFTCRDTKDLFEDVSIFLHLADDVAFKGLGDVAVEVADTYRPHLDITKSQLEVFRQWGVLQVTLRDLSDALKRDQILPSATGLEPPVKVETLISMRDTLARMKSKSPMVAEILRPTHKIIELRLCYLEGNWTELEKLTFALEDSLGVFDGYPECVAELDAAIWHVSYQNALADIEFICRDRAFTKVPLSATDWTKFVENNDTGRLALATAREFAASAEICPVLASILDIAEGLLDLRQRMYDMEIDVAEKLERHLSNDFLEVLRKRNILEFVLEEMAACRLFIKVIQWEDSLEDALLTNQVKPYVSPVDNGTGVTPPEAALRTAGSPNELLAAINQINSTQPQLDPSEFPLTLQNMLNIARKILVGRQTLQKNEEDKSINWDELANEMLVFPDGAFILEEFQAEFDVIIEELARRAVWNSLKSVLAIHCIRESSAVDITVDEKLLRSCAEKFEQIEKRLQVDFPEPPGNLVHLCAFAGGIVDLRCTVSSKNWTDVFSALSSLQNLLNDDGLSVEGVVKEIELIRSVYVANEELREMRDALLDVLPFISDGVSLQDKRLRIDRIDDGVLAIQRLPGEEAKKLVAAASQIREALVKLTESKVSQVSEARVVDAVHKYDDCGLDTTDLKKILHFVRIRQILKSICDVMQESPTADAVFEKLSIVQENSGIKMPMELMPWLQAAEAYAQLLQAIEIRDWLLIVNRCRYLEEIIEPMRDLERHDRENEVMFLNLAQARYREGYKSALDLKAEEANLHVDSASTHVPVSDLRKKKLLEEDMSNPCGITQLRRAGYSDDKILEANFPLPQLWACGFDAAVLRAKGHNVLKLRAAGYSCADLLSAGFTIDQLTEVGFEAIQLRMAGATIDQLRKSGFPDSKILLAGYPVAVLKASGFDAVRLFNSGIPPRELVAAGFSGQELRLAGIDAAQLRKAGMNNAAYLRAAGFDLPRLRIAGFSSIELRAAGFDFDALKDEGFDDKQLLLAGFTEELAREALLTLFDATQGHRWRIRLNWCTSRPLREWYGVTVERGYVGYGPFPNALAENVIAIDLHENRLCGEIPESLSLLIHLRYLNLSSNNLHGSVPSSLPRMENLSFVDLSNNPLLLLGRLGESDQPAQEFSNSHFSLTPSRSREFATVTPPPRQHFSGCDEENAESNLSESDALMELYHTTNGNRWKLRRNWGSSKPLNHWLGITTNRLQQVVKLNLTMNNLYGCIPDAIGNLRSLRELDLRYNQLTGPIPDSIGLLSSLIHLHLHCNRLSGSIPEAIGDLSELVVLDLRSNQLSGTLPETLTKLKKLSYFAVTSNMIKIESKQQVRSMLPWCRAVIL